MYNSKNGLKYIGTNKQYQCANVWQVANAIAWFTNTKTTKDDWKERCYEVKETSSGTWDYIYHNEQDEEFDCSVSIGYDDNTKSYYVWVD